MLVLTLLRSFNWKINWSPVSLNGCTSTYSIDVRITLALLLGIRYFRSRWPAPLIAMVVMTYLSWQFDLASFSITIVDKDAGNVDLFFLPVVSMTGFRGVLRELLVPSINLAVISFVSFMMTARSLPAKWLLWCRCRPKLKALGIANIAAALSQDLL